MDPDRRFFIAGARPVKSVPSADGGLAIRKMDLKTGIFVYNMDMYALCLSSDPNVDELSEDELSRSWNGCGRSSTVATTNSASSTVACATSRTLLTATRWLRPNPCPSWCTERTPCSRRAIPTKAPEAECATPAGVVGSGQTVDGDVVPGFGGELGAMPVGMP